MRPNAMHNEAALTAGYNRILILVIINKTHAYETFRIVETSQCKFPPTSGDIYHLHTYTALNNQQCMLCITCCKDSRIDIN